MARFLDGPAAGVNLLLKRAPVMLRAVQALDGTWDALDQLDDEPRAAEKIVVYRAEGEFSRFHLCRSTRKLSGYYESSDYRVLAEQPADAEVRTTAAWQQWCNDNKERLLAPATAPPVEEKRK